MKCPHCLLCFMMNGQGTPQLSTVEQTMGVECNVMSESKSADYSRLLKMAT